MTNCKKAKKHRMIGLRELCPSHNFPFFAIISTNIGICGGVLIDHNWVWVGKDCIEDIGATRCPDCTSVKLGTYPNIQIRVAKFVITCDQSCEQAVVKVRRSFTLDYRNVYPVGRPSRNRCHQQPYFIFLPYEELDRRYQPRVYHCARLNIMHRCPDDNDWYSWDNGKILCANASNPARNGRGVCDRTLAGPLMCGNRLLGFLDPTSCSCYYCDYLKFFTGFPNGVMESMMRRGGRSDGPSPKGGNSADDSAVDDGRSIHGGLQTKDLRAAMLLALYLFAY